VQGFFYRQFLHLNGKRLGEGGTQALATLNIIMPLFFLQVF
jgi:hypothetical protein